MKSEYQKKLDLIITGLEKTGNVQLEVASPNCGKPEGVNPAREKSSNVKTEKKCRPSLLLHACCGPCSSYVLEYLARYFEITILYYNPNIYPEEEYLRRLNELKNLLPRFPAAIEGGVKLVEDRYEPEDFYNAIGVRENPELADEAEKGERCRRCYQFRLKRAFEYASAHGFDYFCTTLSISPFKDAEKINTIGEALEAEKKSEGSNGPKWLPSDFKKKGGFKRSLELSAEYGLYRQQYCGCVYSKANTEIRINESNKRFLSVQYAR